MSSRLEAVLSAANDAAYEHDLASDAIIWYGAVNVLFEGGDGHMPRDGKTLERLIHPEDVSHRTSIITRHSASGRSFESEFRLRRNGFFGWVHERASIETGEDGQPLRRMGVIRMIDERKLREASIRHATVYDPQTGLFNRSRLMDSVHEHLLQARRYNHPACYVAVGIKHFYPVHGGPRSDTAEETVLIALTHRIESMIRASDVVGRIGRREFGILLPHCQPPDVRVVAAKLIAAFHDCELETAEGNFRVQVAIGGINMPGCALSGFDILNGAEHALAKAREHDGDSFVEFEWPETVSRAYHESIPIGDQVVAALKDNRVEFAFQPIIASGGRQVAFYEALLRLWDENRNLIAAKDFIPAVERLGLSRAIDRATLDLAIDELALSNDVTLALNISGLTVSDPAWLRKLSSRLRGRPQYASRLIIEITETIAMNDMAESIRFVNSVRALGCKVALDDFGAGYITFRHLKALTVDIVKIDGALVKDILNNKDNQAFIRTLVEMARAFRLQIVAEFVENEEEAAFLEKENVTFLQGYYFGKPAFDRPWLENSGDEIHAAQ